MVVIGDNIAASVEATGTCGADQVIAIEGPEYKSYSTDAYANALAIWLKIWSIHFNDRSNS